MYTRSTRNQGITENPVMSTDLDAEEIATLVFQDFTHNSPVERYANDGYTPNTTIQEASLWFNISAYKSDQAVQQWAMYAKKTLECQEHLSFAESLLKELERAKKQATELLNAVQPSPTIRPAEKITVKRKSSRKRKSHIIQNGVS